MSHTPGPLEVSKHGTPEHSPQFGVYAEGENDHAIFTGENAKANADLYAAAPELLEALHECITQEGAVARKDADPVKLVRRLNAIDAICRAAIAKATS